MTDLIDMKKIFMLSLSIVLFSCQNNLPDKKQLLPNIYSIPKVLPVNLQKGYNQNVLTKKAIQPILNSKGKKVITGKPIPLKGIVKQVAPQQLKNPKVIVKPAQTSNNRSRAVASKVYQVQKVAIKNNIGVVTNMVGERLPLGTPIAVSTVKKRLLSPKRVEATALRLHPEALYDIRSLDKQSNPTLGKIFNITKGKNNTLWLATSKGISHYNGASLVHYGQAQGLPSGVVQSIVEDSTGSIWFNPRKNGVCKYDGDSLVILQDKKAILSDYIRFIAADNKGNIWWGTHYNITKYDGQQVTHYVAGGNSKINTLYVDKKGNMWVGTTQGLFLFDGAKFILHMPKNAVSLIVKAIVEDHKGNLWLGTQKNGLWKYNDTSFVNYKASKASNNIIADLKTDEQGNIWIATRDGLNKFDNAYFTNYSNKSSITNQGILNILVDQQGMIWSVGKDLTRYQPHSFHSPQINSITSPVAITSIKSGQSGKVWLGTTGQGLLEFTNNKKQTFVHTHQALTGSNTIYAILENRPDSLWLGVSEGLFCYQQGQLTAYLPEVFIIDLLKDRQGNIWIATLGQGLWKYNGKSWLQYTDKEGLMSNRLYVLLEDHQGNIWIGAKGGVSKFDGSNIIHYTLKEGLSGDDVRTLYEDRQHRLWIGTTEAGLMHFDGNNYTYYTEQEGLPSNSIASIIEDDQQQIWVGSSKGVVCLKEQKKSSRRKVNTSFPFYVAIYQDLQCVDFERNSVYRDAEQVLWWGGNRTLHKLKTDYVNQKAKLLPKKITMQEVKVNEYVVDYRWLSPDFKGNVQYDRIPRFTNVPLEPSFPAYLNHLTFCFTAAGFVEKGSVYYTYRVKGLDKHWSRPTTQGVADYRNLPSGRFVLQIKARTNAQPWGKVFEYEFTIRAPWWQTWWFRLSTLLMTATLLWLVHWQHLRLIKRQKIELEKLVKKKTDEVRAKNEALLEAKEKEKEVLAQTIKNEEQRFLMAVQLFDEKFLTLKTIGKNMAKLSKKDISPQLQVVNIDLQKLIKSFTDIDLLTETIEAKYPQMLTGIKHEFPKLSKNEVRHCLLIKLDCSPKEAAQLLGVSYDAVRMARKRLIKKFDLSEDTSLQEFLNQKVF